MLSLRKKKIYEPYQEVLKEMRIILVKFTMTFIMFSNFLEMLTFIYCQKLSSSYFIYLMLVPACIKRL